VRASNEAQSQTWRSSREIDGKASTIAPGRYRRLLKVGHRSRHVAIGNSAHGAVHTNLNWRREVRTSQLKGGGQASSGALPAREWNGRLERVMVLDKGFAWNGETYGSLSQVAKAMTGTSWNGHRFFGLRTAKSDRSAMVRRRPGVCDAASPDAPSTPIKHSRGVSASASRRGQLLSTTQAPPAASRRAQIFCASARDCAGRRTR
jgi:Protein of unknown function (DUF2924)